LRSHRGALLDQYLIASKKLQSIIDIIEKTLSGDFPLPEPREALKELLVFFKDHQKDLAERLEEHKRGEILPELFFGLCGDITSWIYEYGEAIGFLLRSTNVRNSFEWHWPLQKIADELFKDRPKRVIISAEWNFYPHTHVFSLNENIINRLSDFAFVGLPAYEAGNPLIIPLSGHELGHSLWRTTRMTKNIQDITARVKKRVEEIYVELDPSSSISQRFPEAVPQHCLRQCEEMFCDFLGVALFGSSYLLAFQYFASPVRPRRVIHYPSVRQRATYITWFAREKGVAVPPDYVETFAVEAPVTPSEELLLAAIDSTRTEMQDTISSWIEDVTASTDIPFSRKLEADKILHDFSAGRPCADPGGLPDIVAAGWEYYLRNQPLQGPAFDALANMLLKTVEVWEFNARTRDGLS
jgi:hypothetical protein